MDLELGGVWHLKPNQCLDHWNKIPGIKKPNSWVCNMFFNIKCHNDPWRPIVR